MKITRIQVLQSHILHRSASFGSELHDQDSRFLYHNPHIEALNSPLRGRIYGVLKMVFFQKLCYRIEFVMSGTAFQGGALALQSVRTAFQGVYRHLIARERHFRLMLARYLRELPSFCSTFFKIAVSKHPKF